MCLQAAVNRQVLQIVSMHYEIPLPVFLKLLFDFQVTFYVIPHGCFEMLVPFSNVKNMYQGRLFPC
jgi:hypothetical protein